MLDLVRLRLLLELAHRGTMTAVAEALHLTSSAVSQQLATLERETGAVLLERVGRRVQLTAEGVRLVAHAEAIFAAVEAAGLDLRAARERPQGRLEIGAFSTFAKEHLLPAIVRVRERFPDLQVIVREMEPADSIAAVRDGRCDLAVSYTYSLVPRTETAGLAVQPLIEEPVLLALPPRWGKAAGPVDLARLAGADWIVGSRQTDDRLLAERACATAGFTPRMTHTVDDYDLLLRMVAAGLGIGFVPALALRSSKVKNVATRAAGGLSLVRRIDAVTRRTLAASPAVQALLSVLPGAG